MADNLYTSGGEYVLPTGEEYIGEYHTHPSMGAMVGSVHTDEPHDRLTPIANLRSTDDGGGNGVFQIGGYKPHSGVTLGFSTKSNVWRSRYGFVPTCYSTLDNYMLSHLKPSAMSAVEYDNPQGYTTDIISWDHDGTSLDELNIFYGVEHSSSLEIVSNHNPSSVKIFKAISIEGNGSWGGMAYTNVDRGGEPQQESSGFEFEEREGTFYSDIPASITIENSSRELMFIGFIRREDLVVNEDNLEEIEGSPNDTGFETTLYTMMGMQVASGMSKIRWTIPLVSIPEISIPTSEGSSVWFGMQYTTQGELDQMEIDPNYQPMQVEDLRLLSLGESNSISTVPHGQVVGHDPQSPTNQVFRSMGYNSETNSLEIMTEMSYEMAIGDEYSDLGIPNFINTLLEEEWMMSLVPFPMEMIPIYISQPISKTGEMLRGHYMGANISGTGEIFAINVDFEKTKLDGSLG